MPTYVWYKIYCKNKWLESARCQDLKTVEQIIKISDNNEQCNLKNSLSYSTTGINLSLEH